MVNVKYRRADNWPAARNAVQQFRAQLLGNLYDRARHTRQLLPLGHRQGCRRKRRCNVLLANSFHHPHVIGHGHSTHRTRPRHADCARPCGALATAARRARRDGGAGDGTFAGPYPNAIAGISGWWDAGTFDGLLDAGAHSLPAWNNAAASVADKSGNGNPLAAYRVTGSTLPQATPRLNGLLGGVGLNSVIPPAMPSGGYYLPQMDPDQGFRLATANLGAGERLDLVSGLVAAELAAGSLRSDHAAERRRRDASCRRMACAAQVIGSCCSPAPAWWC